MIILSWFVTMFIARYLDRSWWGPGALLALILGGSALATQVFAPEYYMSLEANLVLQFFVFAVLSGSLLSGVLPDVPQPDGHVLVIRRMRPFIALGTVAALISVYATVNSLGIGLGDLLNPSGFAAVAQSATKQRYLEGVSTPLYGNISSACVLAYFTVLVMHVVTVSRLSVSMIVPVAIFVFGNALVTTRSTLVYMLFLGILAYAYSKSVPSHTFPGLFGVRTVALFGLVAALLVLIFVAFQMLRFGETHAKSVGEVLDYLRRWPWGSIPGFSLWWDGQAPAEAPHTAGYYTFMGIYDNLGIEDRSQGGYLGFVDLTPNEPGNIYTSFRGLLHDFGFWGAMLFLFLLGFAGGAAYRRKIFGKDARLVVFFSVYMWIATSFIFSYWAYVGNIIAAILVPVLFRVFGKPVVLQKERT